MPPEFSRHLPSQRASLGQQNEAAHSDSQTLLAWDAHRGHCCCLAQCVSSIFTALASHLLSSTAPP